MWAESHMLRDLAKRPQFDEHTVGVLDFFPDTEKGTIFVALSTVHMLGTLPKSFSLPSKGFVAVDATWKVSWNKMPILTLGTVSVLFLFYSALFCSSLLGSALIRSNVHSALLRSAPLHSNLLCSAPLCSAPLRSALLRSALFCSNVHSSLLCYALTYLGICRVYNLDV
jgi:hypothetical protein